MHLLNAPLVDISTINAVESLFHPGMRDPHARQLAGQFGNRVVYAECVRYPLPVRADRPPDIPELLKSLRARNESLFVPVEFSTGEKLLLAQEHLCPAFDQFEAWANANSSTLARTLALHSEPWLRQGHHSRVQQNYVFDISTLKDDPKIPRLCSLLKTSEEMVFHAFDVALRYSLYGDLAGEHEEYFSHPMRDAIKLTSQEEKASPAWKPCVDFSSDIAAAAARLSMDDFTAFLHELRGHVHDLQLHRLQMGEVERDHLRELGARMALQVRFRDVTRWLGVLGGAVTALGAVHALATTAALLGGLISLSAAVWTGHVPRQLGKMRWIRAMVRFDIEDQAEQRE